MIKHLFKIIWNQRSGNGWIILELFLVFILLWYIVDFFTVLGVTATTPNGFEIKDTYLVKLSVRQPDNPKHFNYGEASEEPGKNFFRIIDRIRQHPNVEEVGYGKWSYPYCSASMFNSYTHDSTSLQCQVFEVSPEYFTIFKIKPENGDSSEDLSKAISNFVSEPVSNKSKQAIISQTVNEKLFFGKPTTKKVLNLKNDSSQVNILAVTTNIKPYEYTRPEAFILFPINNAELLTQNDQDIWSYYEIFFRTKSSFPANDFAEKFKQEMKIPLNIGNFFLADIQPLGNVRKEYLRNKGITSSLQYRVGFSIFFLINIFLAVIGTFWFRIEQRQSEIGLRMAVGSSRRNILKIMFQESLLLFFIAAIPAILICFNMQKLEFISADQMDLTFGRFIINTCVTSGLLIAVILLGNWYPSYRASRISPADALHYE